MTGASITPERRKFAYFSIPYRKEHWALYSTQKNHARFSKMTLQQLVRARVKIGLVRGYHYGDTLNKVLKQPSVARKIRYSVTSDFNFSKLIKGDLDLVVEHPFARLSPATRRHFRSKTVRLPHYIGGTPIALMFSKKNISKKRIAAIDKALQTMRNEGLTLKTEQQYYNQ